MRKTERGSDLVAGEEPLEIRIGGERVAVTMRTPVPGQDAELALGFVLARGHSSAPDQIARISECRSSEGDGGVADVLLRPGARPADGWQRDFYATSSCGICGKQSIEAVRAAAAAVPDGPQVASRHAVRAAGRAAGAAARVRPHRRPARRGPVHRRRGT